jgi:hypothetical protein
MEARVATTHGGATSEDLRREFDRQVDTLLRKGYAERAGLSERAFRRLVAPLQDRLPEPSSDSRRTPFVVVINSALMPAGEAMPLVELAGKRGFTEMEPSDLGRFRPIDGIAVPAGPAHLAVELDTGPDTLDVTPDDALELITRQHRSPLTLAEGVALVTHYPELLRTQNCFSLLGSRCGDRRVTAIWISRGRPRLGWCWAGNPHTWLGSASCASRVGD